MGKFNKTGKREMPALNTSSLPDLIFTLLFFFMIVTTMREVTLKVEFKVPQATELEKLEKKSLVTFIYVGKPTAEFRKKLGNESRIQLNDSYAEVAEIQDYITGERHLWLIFFFHTGTFTNNIILNFSNFSITVVQLDTALVT